MNAVFPEETFKAVVGDSYGATIPVSVVRNQEDDDKCCDGLLGLVKAGAKLDVLDSDGRDALYYALQ